MKVERKTEGGVTLEITMSMSEWREVTSILYDAQNVPGRSQSVTLGLPNRIRSAL